ncbi:MAG: hypothetical protein ACKVHO_19840, partial [Verrucomicrobiia bacterium]
CSLSVAPHTGKSLTARAIAPGALMLDEFGKVSGGRRVRFGRAKLALKAEIVSLAERLYQRLATRIG